jgi:AcrR family transcriptional regulator
MLRDALLTLIIQRGFDELTIEDITNQADLRRATFYLHYRTKEELLMTVLREIFDDLLRQLEPLRAKDRLAGKTQLETFVILFQHVGENGDLYRVILNGQGGSAIMREIREYLAENVQKALHSAPVPGEVIANTIVGAEIGVMAWWLDNGKPYPPEQMAEMLHRLLLKGVLNMVSDK